VTAGLALLVALAGLAAVGAGLGLASRGRPARPGRRSGPQGPRRRASACSPPSDDVCGRPAEAGRQPGTVARYAGYAIAFDCAGTWAGAFQGVDLGAEEAGWFAGATASDVLAFAAGLAEAGSVASTIGASLGDMITSSSSSRSGSSGAGAAVAITNP